MLSGKSKKGTHRLFVYADVNTLDKHKYHKNKALSEASVEDGLEVNKEKTNYMVESHHQKA
jgi:hypothetical protein